MKKRIINAIIASIITIVLVAIFLVVSAILKKVLPGWLFFTLQVLWAIICLSYIYYCVESWYEKKNATVPAPLGVKETTFVFIGCDPDDVFPKEEQKEDGTYLTMPGHYVKYESDGTRRLLFISLEPKEQTKDGFYFGERSVKIPKDEN